MKVRITKWEPKSEPMTYTVSYAVPEPAKLASIAVMRLQAAVLGRGCGCHTPEELIGLLKDLGVEVELIEGEGQTNAN